MAMLHLSVPCLREEPQEDYRPGGYHPLKAGETVASPSHQYEVLDKLGWGEYSTVWLVRYQASQVHAAMKVMKAELSDRPELHEAEYLRRVKSADPTHPGFQHVSHVLEDFHIEGPNGRHLCLVPDLLGEGLDQYSKRFPDRQVPIAVVKSIFRQVALALMYLHEKCNIIHTDVKSNNILLALKKDATSALSPAATESSSSTSTADKLTVKLIDLGVACWADRVGEHWTDLIQTPALRAPEVVVGAAWGPPVDVWSLGCLVYELATGEFLISHTADEMSIPYLHAMIFGGPYPLPLIQRGKFRSFFFKEDEGETPLAGTIRRRYKGADPEGLIQFLQALFRLDPEERPTLQTLLEHPWLSTPVV